MVSYVDAVVAVTLMRVLLFVLHVCMQREYEGDDNGGVYVFGSGRRWWRGGEWMRGLGLGFPNPVRTGEVLDVCPCMTCSGVGSG